MGQYKVPQNVETEDKILGPLSVKQFIYVVIAVLWAFLMWRIFSFAILIAVIFAFPVTGFFLLLGFGQREGVPFEDYVVAFIRFLIVPRKRIWIKDDSKEVIVKVDKPVEVRSDEKNVSVGELKQLANIIDTRGNFKDPSISLTDNDSAAATYAARIIGPAQIGGVSAATEVGVVANQTATKIDDVLDVSNPRSTQVNQMLQSAESSAKQAAATQVNKALQQAPQANPAMQQPPQVTPEATQLLRQTAGLTIQRVAARANADEQQLTAGSTVQLRQ